MWWSLETVLGHMILIKFPLGNQGIYGLVDFEQQ